MLTAHVVLLPRDLKSADSGSAGQRPAHSTSSGQAASTSSRPASGAAKRGESDSDAGGTVVVFDVLRATTTMTAALSSGVGEIRVFDSLDGARQAAEKYSEPKILAGELHCMPPTGFGLGNSPRQWNHGEHAGRTVFMSTTNGTRAIAAAAGCGAGLLLVGAIVNARAVARAVAGAGADVTLLCGGSDGGVSLEDTLGAGAVIDELMAINGCVPEGDAAQMAWRVFSAVKNELPSVMRLGTGGRNLIRVGLEADIDYCAAMNSLSVVGIVRGEPLCVRRLSGA